MGTVPGASFDTVCLHGGFDGDAATTARGVPVHRTAPFIFKDTETAANLFALRELGMIYSRLGNPTTDVLERRFALLSGAHEMGGRQAAPNHACLEHLIIVHKTRLPAEAQS